MEMCTSLGLVDNQEGQRRRTEVRAMVGSKGEDDKSVFGSDIPTCVELHGSETGSIMSNNSRSLYPRACLM